LSEVREDGREVRVGRVEEEVELGRTTGMKDGDGRVTAGVVRPGDAACGCSCPGT
jgi:hypothetical protein